MFVLELRVLKLKVAVGFFQLLLAFQNRIEPPVHSLHENKLSLLSCAALVRSHCARTGRKQ